MYFSLFSAQFLANSMALNKHSITSKKEEINEKKKEGRKMSNIKLNLDFPLTLQLSISYVKKKQPKVSGLCF